MRLLDWLVRTDNQKWALLAQIVRLFTGLLGVSLIGRGLESDTLAVWYLFGAVFGLASLVEMGMSQIAGRHCAYLLADIQAGAAEGSRLPALVRASRRLYLVLTTAICVLGFLAGFARLNLASGETLFGWGLFVLGNGLLIQNALLTALLGGLGQLWQAQRGSIHSMLINATFLILLVFAHSLLIPASALALAQLIFYLYQRHHLSLLLAEYPSSDLSGGFLASVGNAFRAFRGDAAKMLLNLASYQLLTNSYFLIVTSGMSGARTASYGLSIQLTTIILSFASIWSQSNFYDIASTRQSNNKGLLRQIFFQGISRSVLTFLLGSAAMLVLANPLLGLLEFKTLLFESRLLFWYLAYVFIEFLFGQYAIMLIARGNLQVVYLSLAGGVATCASAWLFGQGTDNLESLFKIRILLMSILYALPVYLMSRKHLVPATAQGTQAP